jgi:Tfp pilus assembly protein PilF
MAAACIALRDFKEVPNILNKISQKEARRSLPLYVLAISLFYQGQYADAGQAMERALAEDPGLLDGWVLMWNIATEQKDDAAARQALARIQEAVHDLSFSAFVDQLAAGPAN